RVSCPLEYPSMAAIVAMGIMVGRKVAIRPKRFDDWTVVPNLWGAIVGRPGTLKSPALNEALRPLREIEEEALREHEHARADFTARRIVAKASVEAIQAKVTKAARHGMAPAELLEMAREASRAEADAAEPAERRLTTQDPTVEALGELL